jgi:recombinational DNA repair ATPase RecF
MELSESEIKNYYLRVKTLLGDLSYMPCDFESMTLDISKYIPLIKTNATPPVFTKLEESAETPKQEQQKKETEEIDLSAGGIFERYIPIAQVYGASPKVGSMSLEKGGDFYFELLTSSYDREIAAGATLYGIHKDDIDIKLNDKSARLYASQGQQRSLSLALKIAEGEICREEYGDYPVMLLDDVLSELDEGRREYLMNELHDKQVIITSCERVASDNAKVIRVEKGKYIEV